MEGFDFEVPVVRGSLESHEAVEEQDLETSNIGQFLSFLQPFTQRNFYTI